MFSENETSNKELYKLESFINKNVSDVSKYLEDKSLNPIIIGNGTKVVKQYPNKNTEVLDNDKIFLITNSDEYKMLNIKNWSRSDVIKFCNITNLECTFTGNGYVTNQSIDKNTILNKDSKLEVELSIKEVD